MITVLVKWESEKEIEKALAIRNQIHELLDSEDLHSGSSTVNIPPKTFGLNIKKD